MLSFVGQRLGIMVLTMVCLTVVVFFLVNLEPNLERLAISQTNQRVSEQGKEDWLKRNGFRDNFFARYAAWLGLYPKAPIFNEDGVPSNLAKKTTTPKPSSCRILAEPQFSGILQGDFGCSTKYKQSVASKILPALAATGWLMFWVMIVMVPMALALGIFAGMREGSKTDRGLSVGAIVSSATPEYVSGVVFIAIFASALGWFNGSAASAVRGLTFYNFTLPVLTMAIYGMGYISRMTRASMVEVMASQYIRTARLKGMSFWSIILKHALRNALIAPFTVIMLYFPFLLTGVVIVERMFAYKGFGYVLVDAAENNDIDLLLACSLVSVFVVLITQLLSDIGYAYLNPRIRVK